MRIMVVDDERDVRLLFEQRFRQEIRSGTYVFTFAYSAEDALAVLDGNGGADLVLVLSDINMPGMSGLDLLRQIRGRGRRIPVFMLTAYHDDHTRDEAVASGANDYFPKPIDFKALKQKLAALSRQEQEEGLQ